MICKVLLMKVILTIMLNTERVTGQDPIDWKSLWSKMTSSDHGVQLNFRSNCPWKYALNPETGEIKPQLLPFARRNCLDFSRSHENDFVTDPRGQCAPVYSNCPSGGNSKSIVGFTCSYAIDRPANVFPNNRNIHVEHRSTDSSSLDSMDVDSEAFKPIVSDDVDPAVTKYKDYLDRVHKDTDRADSESFADEDKDLNNEETHKYKTEMQRYLVPQFLNNAKLLKMLTNKIVKRWMRSYEGGES